VKLDEKQTSAKIIKRGQLAVNVELKIAKKDTVAVLVNYEVKSSKLVKFKDTKLEAVKFTQSGSRGKLLISFD
jgi:hypothetical protein